MSGGDCVERGRGGGRRELTLASLIFNTTISRLLSCPTNKASYFICRSLPSGEGRNTLATRALGASLRPSCLLPRMFCKTCQLVMMWPSWSYINPLPLPRGRLMLERIACLVGIGSVVSQIWQTEAEAGMDVAGDDWGVGSGP